MKSREFTCIDCGVPAIGVSMDPGQLDLCGPCAWKRETKDPAERRAIEGLTHRRPMADDEVPPRQRVN